MQVELLSSAMDLSDADWGRLQTGGDPFISRAFLGTAETTGAAGEALGWRPLHVLMREGDRPAGLLPLYLRNHSFGDFSQDWHWPQAWRQAGLDYYPKLVTGVPFTPSPGPRLLTTAEADAATGDLLIETAKQLTADLKASSWQCLFLPAHEHDRLQAAGLLLRRGVQFHWSNRGFADFDDFLAGFTAEKRKKVRRERRQVADAGFRIETRHGDDIDPHLWSAIYRHYRDTFLRYGNHPAFSLDFFRTVGRLQGHGLVVFIAWQDDHPAASAICYRNDVTLFGRHWGTDTECPGLHFELCYYSGIEYAISHGLQRFEPGAQGEHKLARGFEPVPTWSAYWVADQAMRRVVARFLEREAEAVQCYQDDMASHLPFRAEG